MSIRGALPCQLNFCYLQKTVEAGSVPPMGFVPLNVAAEGDATEMVFLSIKLSLLYVIFTNGGEACIRKLG